jgi:hypothetical protein
MKMKRSNSMNEATPEAIVITQRVNGWWVTLRDETGHEEHHGPYDDEPSARREADLLAAPRTVSDARPK